MNWILSIGHEQSKLAFKLSSEEFSCQRVQSQICLSYAECSRKSLVCKMYEILNKQEFFFNNVSVKPNEQNKACFSYVMARKCIELNI